MPEIFEGLSVAGDPITEEDRVVHLLASLPELYNMLVTAIEENADVPKMEVVTERLLHDNENLRTEQHCMVQAAGRHGSKAKTKEKGIKP